MRFAWLLLPFLILTTACDPAKQAPSAEKKEPAMEKHKVLTGDFRQLKDFPSKYVKPRNISIWLPPGYEGGTEHYPVIYTADGPNMFEDTYSYGGEWGLDEIMQERVKAGTINPAIIVGIWQTDKRWNEYVPQKVIEDLPADIQKIIADDPNGGKILSDDYVRFVVEEVKPYIDAHFRTLPDRDHTYHLGSSMGGLISLYMAAEHPEVFGGAACVSTHWPLAAPEGPVAPAAMAAMTKYLTTQGKLDPAHQKLWFDHGDQTLDANYGPYQKQADKLFEEMGFVPGQNYETHVYPGMAHNEIAWHARSPEILEFLLGTPAAEPKPAE